MFDRRFLRLLLPILLAFWPLLSLAQTPPEPNPAPPLTPPEEKAKTPPAANPFVLFNPQDGSGNSQQRFDPDGVLKRIPKAAELKDYRRPSADPRLKPPPEPLPLFGYAFFEPARRLIMARNAQLLRMYEEGEANRGRLLPMTTDPRTARPSGNVRPGAPATDSNGVRTPFDEIERPPQPSGKRPDTSSGANLPEEDDSFYPASAPRQRPALTGPPVPENLSDTSRLQTRQEPNNGEAPPTRPTQPSATSPNLPMSVAEANLTRTERLTRLRRENAQRALAGLPPLPENALDRTSQEPAGLATLPAAPRSETPQRMRAPYQREEYNDYAEWETPYLLQEVPPRPIDAYREIADPLTQLYRNVIGSVPATYQLSGGDLLTVRVSSPTMPLRQFRYRVDERGDIALEGLPPLNVSGLTLSQAQGELRRQMRRLYRNAEITLTLAELRTISVTVSGEAFLPGTFHVPAVATAFNVLSAAGGPTREGSLRNIRVLRQGKLVGALDIYQFLVSGEQADIPLQNGDLIVIPPGNAYVTLRGEVRRPALFELKEGETLQDALRFAGGAKPSGVDQLAQLNTFEPGANRVIKNVNLRDQAELRRLPLYDGDEIDIFSVRPILANKVTIEGAVDQPNDYALEPRMRVSDLIQRARGTLSEAYLHRAELYRWNPNNTTTLIPIDLERALSGDPKENLSLERWDRLKIYTRSEVAWTGYRKVTVSGAVVRPGIYDLSANTRVSDLLRQVGGPRPDASLEMAVLLHQRGDGTFSYEFIRLADILRGDREADALVQDNDVLAIYREGEAKFTPDHLVTILGEVVAPGVYPRGEGMRLSDLIRLAGGFKPNSGTTVTVAHARRPIDGPNAAVKTQLAHFDSQQRCAHGEDVLLEDGDVVTVQGTGGFVDRPQIVTVKGAVQKPGPIVLTSKSMRLSDALRQAGGPRPEAFPEGAEFYRDPRLLASTGQRDLAETISLLNNLLNDSAYKREVAKADVERIQAVGAATVDSTSAFGGFFGSAPPAPNPATGILATELSKHELVSKPRELKPDDLQPNGNIAVNLPAALKAPGSKDDILLVDGDTITIPEKPTTVQVVGAVVNGRAILHKPGANLDYYVTQAGGFAPDAAKDRIQVIHAGGGLTPASKVRELQTGDLILVPTRVLAEKITRRRSDFESLFRFVTGTALSYALVRNLFN